MKLVLLIASAVTAILMTIHILYERYRLKQLNEYADELENEISVLKETPKVEVLLNDMPKPLVEVPQLVAVWFEDRMLGSFSAVVASYSFNDDEAITWVHDNGGLDLLCKMKLYGYTVEKEQMFYLKNVMTNNYLMQHKLDFRFGESDSKEDSPHWQTKFNQSEIDDMETGSYEQIEVEP